MKKIILFYILCSLTICCFDIIMMWFALDHCDIGCPDFKFGFNVMMLANCAIYAPIFTLSACILYYTNINKGILSNKLYAYSVLGSDFSQLRLPGIVAPFCQSIFGSAAEGSSGKFAREKYSPLTEMSASIG